MKQDLRAGTIKNSLDKQASKVKETEGLFNRVREQIYEEEQKMNQKTSKGFKHKRAGLLLATCLVVGSVTVLAGVIGEGGSWIGSSSSRRNTTFPKLATIEKKVGFAPKYLDTLPGGYTFVSWGTGKMHLEEPIKFVHYLNYNYTL